MTRFLAAVFLMISLATQVVAQQPVWVQVEAQPTLREAQSRVRAYDAQFDNVAGFTLGNRWYGIVLGPYSRPEAERVLRSLRAQRAIPGDSFIATGTRFGQQFWPIGISALDRQPDAGSTTEEQTEEFAAEITIIPADETPAQARASERLLSREQREELQIALQWAGFYNAAIDGAFGRGTRRSMGEWQAANNHEVTGVLTSAQRVELIADYNSVLEGMDLAIVRDATAGIEMQIPTGVVSFASYDPPFARYDATSDLEAQVLLISQAGGQDRAYGLYEIMQTLEIFPMDGPRSRGQNSFEIEGIGDGRHSYAQVSWRDGEIKGFALIWPQNDEERRTRVLAEMKESFVRLEGVIDPTLAPATEEQAIDLVAGLAVRQPQSAQSGFYIDGDGTVLTALDAVGTCEDITIDTEHTADVIHTDEVLGLAVLRPQSRLAPLGVASFQTSVPRLQSEVAVAGYPYGGVLTTPSLTFGRLADLRGLKGEEEVKRLALRAQPGDVGGPVFDVGGSVLGMLLPRQDLNGQVLPAEVNFSVDSEQILSSLDAAGISVNRTDAIASLAPETLTLRAVDQTVLVSCW